MNRFPFTLVALAAAYTPGSRFRTDFADHSLNSKTFIDDGNDTSDGAGGASTEAKAEISAGAGTDQVQQQAQASDTSQVGGELSAKAETGTDDAQPDAGLGSSTTIVGDPSAGTETLQV